MAYEEFSGELDKPTGFEEFTGKLDSELPSAEKPGLIDRALGMAKDVAGDIVSAFPGMGGKPEYKSVMEGYQPSPQELQADAARRLSYGAGPISKKTEGAADLVRSGLAGTDNPVVQRAAEGMQRVGAKSTAGLLNRVQRETDQRGPNQAGVSDFLSDAWAAASGLPNAFASAYQAMAEGNDPAAMDWKNGAIIEARQRQQENASIEGAKDEYILGITRDRVRNLPQNLAFSLLSMGAGLVAGITAGTATAATGVGAPVAPFAGYSAGAMASGVAAYRMDTNNFLRDIREKLDAGSQKAQGRPLTDEEFVKIAQKYESLVREHGLWEALPEAAGNVLGAKIGGAVFKLASEGLKKSIIGLTAGAAANFGSELGTETVTQTGQHNVEVEAKLKNEPKRSFTSAQDWKKSAEEVLPDVLLLTGVTTGGAHIAGKVYDKTYNTPERQLARAIGQDVAGAGWTTDASQVAADRLSAGAGDAGLLSPVQTVRGAGDVGPSAPIRAGEVPAANFTPADSPSAMAGLAPIVVPATPVNVPNQREPQEPVTVGEINPQVEQEFGLDTLRMGGTNVGTTGGTGAATSVGNIAGGDQSSGGVGTAGSGVPVAAGNAGDAGLAAANAGQDVVAGSGAGQQPAAVTPQQDNNANTQPTEQWFGRKGDGYTTEADASQALPGRKRMFPDLSWSVERMANGKFRLAGYVQTPTATDTASSSGGGLPTAGSATGAVETTGLTAPNQETVRGTQAAQTVEAKTQGQETPQPAGAVDFSVPQGALPDSVLAELSRNPDAASVRTQVQSKLDGLVASGRIAEAPKLNAPDPESEAAINVMGNLFGQATGLGQKVVAYSDPVGANGFELGGVAFINTAMDQTSVAAPRTVFHEIRHVVERLAAADTRAGRTDTPAQQFTAKMDGIFDDMTDEGKRSYIEKFLHKEELDGIKDPAAREARVQELMTAPTTRSEMVADFLGNRATDRAFLVDLAKTDPKGFQGFVQKWLSVVDNLIAKLRGGRTQGKKESALVDQYVRDLSKAKMVARDALIAFRKGNLGEFESQAEQEQQAEPVMSSKQDDDINAKLQQRLDTDFNGAAQEYAKLDGTKGGRVLDTDMARELSPEYRQNRNRAAEVHEAASDFVQRSFEQRLANAEPGGEVAFMAGGGGSGKSSAESLLGPVLNRAHTVYDGTLSSYDKAERNVQMALDAGQLVNIFYVYRDPEEAFRNGVLTRAMKKGRTVPVDALVKGHAGSSEVVRKLQEKFGGNSRFMVHVVDNSRGPGKAAMSSLDNITPVIKSGLKERFENAARQEFEAGRISETVYRATTQGRPDAGAGTQGQAADAGVRPRDQGVLQERRGSERAGYPVTADEAVVGGVRYSAKQRNLVDIPTVELKDLVGKKVVGIKADLTDAGRSYTGIDGSQLEFPVEMMGGPNYVRLPENAKANVVWAVRGGATLSKIMEQVKKSDYVLVHAMNGNSHLTNSTISTAYLQTVEAYLRDGRISKENLAALDEIVRSPKNKSSLPDFPGFESPGIYEYIDGLSFDQRGALASMLEKKEAQAHGLPNLDRFRRETIDPDFVGYRQGDAMLVLEVDKSNPTVKLGENGTKMHPSYPLGLRGKVIGKLAKGINYETIFRDYFQFAVPNFKNGEAGAWYAFDRKMPIQKITPEIANSVTPGSYASIKTARQAEAALHLANGNWLQSGRTKALGGVSVQEFVDALRANEGAAALTLYTPEEVKAGIRDKSFSVYQLGKDGGDKGMQVFFGLKRGTPWYKDMIDGVGDNEVEVVSVTNNEPGAPGIGIPAIITKAIQEGATVLDAFAVKSERFPGGFLPEMYGQFGFEEIGRIPFDPSYYDATQMSDLKAFWSKGGWSESDGYPDVVVMRWKGNDEDRATAVERYVRTGETGVSAGDARFTGSPTEDAHGQRDQSRAEQGRSGRSDRAQARGDQGAGNAASVVSRAHGSIQELARLSDGDIRNLGLDPAEVQRLRDSLDGVRFSIRSAEPAGGSSTGRDQGDAVKVEGAVHYGRQGGLSVLSGTSFGTGIKGAEQERLAQPGVDPRIKRRVYFYLPMAGGIPAPEIGLGSNVYTANLSNLYDPSAGTRRFPSDPNAFESAVLDAGFRGYINREQGTAVVLDSSVPVKFIGGISEQRVVQRKIERIIPKVVTRQEGGELVRRPTNEEMSGIIRARPELTKVAPSFRLQFGEARVKAGEAEAVNEALAQAGASFRFDVAEEAPAFSERQVSLEEDLRQQQEFLQQRAEAAGYKTVDEFVDQDYEAFVTAAKEWRDTNMADVMFSKRVSPADKIKWRKISDVKTEIGLDSLPGHIVPFANFMRTMADKTINGDLSARDLIKAYTIARSSMNRGAITTDKARAAGLTLPESFTDAKIRPEGAFGYWLLSEMGQRYLNAAERQEVDAGAIADAVKVMAPFGTQNALGRDLERAAGGDLHARLPGMAAAIVKASMGKNAVKDWQEATDNLFGVREAKKGFLGSLLGFGQLPTFDARQININVDRESKEDTLRALSSTKARDVVAKLARRMDALSLTMDPEYAPFYRHLVHHAVWDAVGGTETTHEDVMESMLMASKRQLGYYSQLARAIDNVPEKLANQPAKQWGLWLDANASKLGIKKDEIEWSGIKDFLAMQPGKVSKQQIAAYLDANGVRVEESVMKNDVERPFGLVQEGYPDMVIESFKTMDEASARLRSLRYEDTKYEIIDIEPESPVAYESYTLPGATNYREVLLTLPSNVESAKEKHRAFLQSMKDKYGYDGTLASYAKKMTPEERAEAKQLSLYNERADYRSSHWDQPNVLAHIRVNDRVDADGKRVLFVEELQSDWGQDKTKGKDVPAGPFISKTEGWLNLALKRVAMMAAQGNYEQVAFVNGEQSSDRYDLSKKIQSISFKPEEGKDRGYLEAWDENRRLVLGKTVKTGELPDHIGKEVSDRLLATEPVMGRHLLDGEQLKVGGEGMKTFYDQIVPQAINKLLPIIGKGKVTTIRFNGSPEMLTASETADGKGVVRNTAGEDRGQFASLAAAQQYANQMNAAIKERPMEQLGFDVTDAMRDAVNEGLPLFSQKQEAAETKSDPDVVRMFANLQDARGLQLVRAKEAVAAHTMGEQILKIHNDFYDILEQLDDAGLIKINC